MELEVGLRLEVRRPGLVLWSGEMAREVRVGSEVGSVSKPGPVVISEGTIALDPKTIRDRP